MKKKILYISYDGLTDPLGQSQVLPYLQGLSELGYQFTILSFEKSERMEKEGDLIRGITEKSGIEWVPMSFTKKPPVFSKIYDRYRMWKKALLLHHKYQFDLTHCRSYVSAEVGLKLKRKYGIKFLFDMRGFWADEKMDNGQWDNRKIFFRKVYNHYKEKEKQFLTNADGIISLTMAASEYLKKQPLYNHLS
ncbi:MAG: glycosyltransferase, partial [Chitinophagaceae bacterium]